MLKRYLVSTAGKPYYITKFYIIKIDNILRFGYDIHVITNNGIASMINNIDQSFINNPESDNIFNKLATEKKFSHTISQLEAVNVISTIEKAIAEESYKSYIKISLPRANLYFELNKVKLLYNFIRYFYDNYENIKLEIDKKPNPIELTADVKTPVNVEVKDISSKIFNELCKLSPNNIISFFILKQISHLYTGQTLNFKLEEESNITIEVELFTSNLMLLYNDLNVLINFRPTNISEEEYKVAIKSKITLLIKLLLAIYDNESKLNSNDKYLYINFIVILLYIYGFWLNGSDFNININIYTFVNKVIFSLKGNMGKIKNIKFFPLPISHNSETKQVDISKINTLAAKYKYLIDFDRERFIKNIINDIESDVLNEKENKPRDIVLSKAKLLDLSNNELPLHYQLISDQKLQPHKIITKAYHSLLILENSINIFNIDNIDEQLPKLIDIINSKILPFLRKNSEMIILNPSVLLIYNNFIEPNIINNSLSIKEKMYLIFDICIPFLYDNFKINKFIDYFH